MTTLSKMAAGLVGAGLIVGTAAGAEAQSGPAASGGASSLFIVDVLYRKPLSEIDAALPAHVAFLDRHYEAGDFLLSGRKVPRTGGVILARASSREALSGILTEDPFQKAGIAEYVVTEFQPTKAAPSLATLLPKK